MVLSPFHCLVTVSAVLAESGARYGLHAASAQDRRITGLGGVRWEPALVEAPEVGIELFNGDFGATIRPAALRLRLQMETLGRGYPYVNACAFGGAEVELRIGKAGDPWPWRTIFKGRVRDYARADQVLTLSVEVDDEPFKADQLSRTYAGTGGAEGGSDLKDRPKPLAIGWTLNVEPVLIDVTNSVYQFSGYGPIEAVTTLFERASAFSPSTGDHASYAALVAADIAPGMWATCLAEGLVRLGAPAFGVITGDIKGHKAGATTPRLTGEIIQALADIAGVDAALIADGTFDALDRAVPYPVNLFMQDQASFADTAQRLALPCNAQSGVSLTGQFFVTRVDMDRATSLSLDARGRRLPKVGESAEAKTSAPYARMIFGANQAWRVHSTSEVAFQAELVDVGLYDETKTYREGNIVSLPDKSRWLYINETPSAGNAPPEWPTTSNDWWENLDPPATASGLTYEDGTPIEDLKPAEPGADVTSSIPEVAETVILADNGGTPKAGQVNPRYVQFRLIRNGVDETENADWAATLKSGDMTASMSDTAGTKGRLNITAIATDSATTEIAATFGSRVVKLVHKVRRQRDSAPSSGGGGSGTAGSASGTIDMYVFDTTPEPIGDEIEVTVGSGGGVTLNASYEFSSDQVAGSQTCSVQWYKWNGSAYVAIGSASGPTTNYTPSTGLTGQGSKNHSDSGNAASSVQKYRLYGAAGGSYTVYFAGECSAVAS